MFCHQGFSTKSSGSMVGDSRAFSVNSLAPPAPLNGLPGPLGALPPLPPAAPKPAPPLSAAAPNGLSGLAGAPARLRDQHSELHTGRLGAGHEAHYLPETRR